MKKLLALLLAGAMLFALAACGGTSSSSGSSDAESGSSPSGPDSSAASDSSESDAEAGRWDALHTTDEPVQLSFELNSFMPTINTEPTEEAPLVRVAPRKVLEEWLEDKPNVKADWNFRNRDGNDDEWLTIQFTAKTAPDLIEQGGTRNLEDDWYILLDDVLASPNYYETGSPIWRDMFPEYLFANSTSPCVSMRGNIFPSLWGWRQASPPASSTTWSCLKSSA